MTNTRLGALGCIFLLVMTIQMSTKPVYATSYSVNETELKLAPDMREQLLSMRGEYIDAIIVCDWEEGPDYVERVYGAIDDFSLTANWEHLRILRANLTKTQVYDLAKLPFVVCIDNNTIQKAACMDDAREHTNVDYLRSQYPYDFDGDGDGYRTIYSPDDIVIAVLDSGIDTGHEDLDGGKVLAFEDFVYEETESYDDIGHGTHCASIAAGSGDGNWSLRGVAPYAALVGLKIMDSYGSIKKDDALDAFDWVAAYKTTYGIEIVSCSWGFHPNSYYYPVNYGVYESVAIGADNLVRYHDLVVVCAAGNDGPDEDTIRTPGTGKYVITVGNAIDPGEGGWELNTYPPAASSQGPCDDGRIKPDILAPGTNIEAAKWDTTNDYWELTGTSMATPFVAGLIALYLDYEYSLRYNDHSHQHPDIKLLLMASAVDMPDDTDPGKDNAFGSGRIDAWAMKNFYDTDISDYFDDAPTALYYQWGGHYSRDNEPLWRGVVDAYADFYKVYAYAGMFIGAIAIGDYDLKLRVYLYDRYRNLITMSSWGRIKYVQHWATYTGLYYVRVSPHITPTSGDYYDMDIYTEGS
ncbi:MAG: S8 family serine peptidase [Candidatus Thorarchaeota archaeon]